MEHSAEVCDCGHARDWHSHGGRGDCEHDADCPCQWFQADPHDDAQFRLRDDDAA